VRRLHLHVLALRLLWNMRLSQPARLRRSTWPLAWLILSGGPER
jgi:hypothetical protein